MVFDRWGRAVGIKGDFLAIQTLKKAATARACSRVSNRKVTSLLVVTGHREFTRSGIISGGQKVEPRVTCHVAFDLSCIDTSSWLLPGTLLFHKNQSYINGVWLQLFRYRTGIYPGLSETDAARPGHARSTPVPTDNCPPP